MNTCQLGSIVEIRTGTTLRGRDATRPDTNGSCKLLRIGDISPDGELSSRDLPRIEPNEELKKDQYLLPGDVLFPNRGTRTTALTFDLDEPNVIAGAQFFVLRVDPCRVVPEYLAWFLRSEAAASHFNSRRKGTLVQVLQRKDLEDLPFAIPPLGDQKRIVELSELARHERQLSEQLTALKWRHCNLVLAAFAQKL
jgi:restriction endonuclease S subunit